MNNKCLQLSTTIGIMLLICAFAAAQGEPIQVLYPVSGRLAYAVATELRVIDTETAEVTAGDTTIDEALVAYERWSGDGSKISYLATGNIQILDWQTRQVIGTYPYRTNGSFFPEGGWNGSGTQILGVTGDLDWDYDEVQIFDLASGARTTVLRYYDDMPIPQIPDRLFFSIIDLDWNPVYDDWIVICIDTSPLGSENDPELFGEYRGLLYNISTGQSFILDELFSEPLNLASRIRWSSDGNYLLVGTGQFNVEGHYHIVRFQPEVAGQPLKVVQTAPAILRHGILDWVGMGDLFILQTYDTDQTLLLLIAQIIDGELHTTGFLRIPVTTAHMSRGDWVLDAGPEERAALSCLFDQTLEARLAVGMGGRSPSRTVRRAACGMRQGWPVRKSR